MNKSTNELVRLKRAIRPSREAALAQAKRRRGPRPTPPARKPRRPSDVERFNPPVPLAEWVSTMREARRYLGRIDWRRLAWNAEHSTLSPRQSNRLLRLMSAVMGPLLRIAYRSNPVEFNQLLNLTGFGAEFVKYGDGGDLDGMIFFLKEIARTTDDSPHQVPPPLQFVIYLAAAIETLDKRGVDLDTVFPK